MTVPARLTRRDASSPVADSLLSAASLVGYLDVRYGPPVGDDWLTCADLLDQPERFDQWRARLARWLEDEHGESNERATAGYVMSWYLGAVGLLGGVLFHTARRVPSLRPSDVALRIADEGRPHVVGLALLSGEFACLPDDAGGDHPSATAVADDAALAALLRARFAAHAAAFVASYGTTVRLGRRMLWAAATDALDSAAWTAGLLCGDEDSGVADSALLLPEQQAPFTAASTFRPTPDGWARRRESCCFHFTLPGATACAGCPRTTPR
ncbi:hypothetical protein JOF41_006558 [Saccharothrix coeruleofusca]|uniref:(2Fe-2S)-binding protein n=1 Tax=Saccharothrix coeruleofusca TaxID=33919 RepID=UPI001AE54EB1|nr:(2Fe-2S)-binding protein [Saccharothrix coeruleofusca]MBP2340380.1 hypothetical protein [Saccharothrix coeruleofusca]